MQSVTLHTKYNQKHYWTFTTVKLMHVAGHRKSIFYHFELLANLTRISRHMQTKRSNHLLDHGLKA